MKEFKIVRNLSSVYKPDQKYLLNNREEVGKAISIILDHLHHALDDLISPIPADWLLILADDIAEYVEEGMLSACHLLHRHVICSGAFVGSNGVLKDFYPPTPEECVKFAEDGFLDLEWETKVYPTYEDYQKRENAEEWTATMLWDQETDPRDIEDILQMYDGQCLFKVCRDGGTAEDAEFLDEKADASTREGVRFIKERMAAALSEKRLVPKDLYDYITPIQFAEVLTFRELLVLLIIESGVFIGGHFEDFVFPEDCIVYKNGRLQVPEMSDEAPKFLNLDRRSPLETIYLELPDPSRKSHQEFGEILFGDL